MKNLTPKGGRRSVLKQKVNQYEQQMKEKFMQVMSDDSMKYADCLDYIETEIQQSKKMAKIFYRIPCFRNDGVYQLSKAIEQTFGPVAANDNQDPSGSKEVNTIDIELADGTREKVIYGEIKLEGLGEGACVDIDYLEETHELLVRGKCQFRFQSVIDDIINRTQENLSKNSIYKGQAIEISDINNPKIIKLDNIDDQLMVLSEKTKYDLRPVMARLLSPERCIEKGIPLKFGALLEGGYGTGKTLLAFKLARQAVQNGWMFIYLKDPKLLAEALRMSKIIDQSGHGVLVFVEDIDQVTRGNRDESMQDILNTLDGGDTKDMNVITLFTTNHIELIEPTFLRGKRIGSIISMGCLDAQTADIFIRESFKIGCYTINEDLTEICKYIEENHIAPAFMAEIIEKVKSMMVLEDQCEVKAIEIKHSVDSYLRQVQLSKTKDMSVSPEQKFVDSFREVLYANKSREDQKAFIKAMEDHMNMNIDAYRK